MGRVLRFPKWATQSERRITKARRNALGYLGHHHRRLVVEPLEDRRLLSGLSLGFPLQNRAPDTVTVTSVFDHSMPGGQYTADNVVVAYTGERGESEFGQSAVSGTSFYGYENAEEGYIFIVNGNYSAGSSDPYYRRFLFYDGHPGYDFKTSDQGTGDGKINVLAAASGTVQRLVAANGVTWGVRIDHGNGYKTNYYHLSQVNVSDGASVNQGQVIGVSGGIDSNGADTFAPHLHFSVTLNDVPVDPYGWQGTGIDPYTSASNVYLWSNSDTSPPTLYAYSAANINTGGSATQTFNVTYTDNEAVNVLTLGDGNVYVTGPNGYSQLATYLSVDNATSGTPRTATYQIAAPDGTWDSTDNGTYSLIVQSGQVGDTSENYMATTTFGSFNVNVSGGITSTVTLISPGGDESVEGGLRVVLDPYGAFGSAAEPAENAWFNPSGDFESAGTTYQSAVFLRSADWTGFLAEGDIGGSGNLSSISFDSTSASSAVSSFICGNLSILLTQTIQDRFDSSGAKVGSMLVQKYQITNIGTSAVDFSMVRYLDGDLYYSGDFRNDWGGASTTDCSMNQQLFEFDTGDDPSNPTTLIGIRAIGGGVPDNYFEIDSFSGLQSRIIVGTALDNTIAGDGGDSDLVTDGSYDITLALQRDFHLSPSEPTQYTTVTEFGLGTTGESPIDPIDEQQESGQLDYYNWDYQYDTSFSDNQELVAHIRVDLVGDAPVGPNGEDLAAIWEAGIESAWNGQYEIVDGINRYPILIDVEWVNTDADYIVTVDSGDGSVNATHFYTHNPSGWGFEYQGIIAAHEAGHWLGLYDEYNPMNGGDPAWWPLYDENGNMITDFWGLYDGVNGNPLANWTDLSANADMNALMAQIGEMESRYYQALLNWLEDETGRDLVLAEAPTFTSREPMNGFSDTPPGLPELSIGDVTFLEGDSGTKTFTFTVSMSGSNTLGASVSYATADGTATAGSDYVTASSTLTWAAGDTSSKTISITVNGDTTVEPDETFYVNLTSPTNATVSKGQGAGTIQNDEATWQDTIGLFAPTSSKFYLRNTNDAGYANLTFPYGPANADWKPIAGDWNTDGTGTIGLYNPTTSVFYLRNTNNAGYANLTFAYGPANAGWLPIAGDWDGDGKDTIGLYNPTASKFFLRNTNDAGYANVTFAYGPANAGWLPIAGDWDGDGTDTIGLYNPTTSVFFLHNSNTTGVADVTFSYGPANAGWKPVAGDWNADGTDTIGLYNPATSKFFQRNTNTAGYADVTFAYGPANAGWLPIAGDWNGSASPLRAAGGAIVATDTAPLTDSALQPLITEAIARWAAVGLSTSSLSVLSNVNYAISDLPSSYLGLAEENTIYLDRDAAGHGWFVDPTPADDLEFDPYTLSATDDSPAANRVDLLTTVMHEMGHLLGYDHADNDLMSAILPLGVRRLAAVDEVFATLHGA